MTSTTDRLREAAQVLEEGPYGYRYQPGTEIVTMVWDDEEAEATGTKSVRMDRANLYPRGGQPTDALTVRKARTWCVAIGLTDPARIYQHTQGAQVARRIR